MSVEKENVPNKFAPNSIEHLRASNMQVIASSKELIHLIKAYMQEKNEQRKQWILVDIIAKSEAKRN